MINNYLIIIEKVQRCGPDLLLALDLFQISSTGTCVLSVACLISSGHLAGATDWFYELAKRASLYSRMAAKLLHAHVFLGLSNFSNFRSFLARVLIFLAAYD